MAVSLFRNKNTARPSSPMDPKATTGQILAACNDAGVSLQAKDLIDIAPSKAQFDQMLAQIQGVADRCAAFAIDEPKAGAELAEVFLRKMIVGGDWGAAVGAMLTDASDIAAGEEIDHHSPAEPSGDGGLNPFTLYSKANQK